MSRIGHLVSVLTILVLAPTMTRAAAPPLEAYGRLPSVEYPVISPSGLRLAYVVAVGEKRRLVTRELPGKILAVAELGDIKVRGLQWAGEELVVANTSSTQNLGVDYGLKHELFNLAILNVTTSKVLWPLNSERVFNAALGFYGVRQSAQHWYAFVGTLRLERSKVTQLTVENPEEYHIAGSEPQLTRVDLATGELKTAAPALRYGRGWLLDAAGEVIANERYNDSSKTWTLYAGAHDTDKLADLTDRYGEDSIIGQGRTPGTVLYQVVDSEHGARYMEAALDGKSAPTPLFAGIELREFLNDRTSGLLDGIVVEGNEPELRMFGAEHIAVMRAAQGTFPTLRVMPYSMSEDYRRLVVQTEGQQDSGTWWFVDLKAGTAVKIGSLYPEVGASQMGPYRVVKYHAADGLELEGVLTLPPGKEPKNLPLVALPHGGPEARDHPGFDWWAQAFASRGYAVWQPNFRGSSGYGADFRDKGFGEWGRKMQTDVSDGIVELAQEGIVDPKRACVVGGSYGGYVALAGVTLQHGVYRCAVSVAGVADLQAMLFRTSERSDLGEYRYWRSFMGVDTAPGHDIDPWSPDKHAGSADAPVLLIHGKDDTVVPIEQSRLMKKALESAGKTVEFVELDSEDHHLSREKTRQAMLRVAVDFVQRYNPP